MKRLIIGVAAAGAAFLLGCKTDTNLVGHSSAVTMPAQVAKNPNLAQGERGFLLGGTVIADYKDAIVIEDERGFQRAFRIQDDTLFRQQDGEIVARQYLEPGSEVRAAFDYNNQERIAQEIIIVQDLGEELPNAWPENPTPYNREP